MAFHHLLRKLECTKSQKWLHCLDLEALVERHTRFLHGVSDKKVVLDARILNNAKNGKQGCVLTTTEKSRLRPEFEKEIRYQCAEAAKANSPDDLLVLISGHGDMLNKGIGVGAGPSRWLDIVTLKDIFKGTKCKVSFLTSACFSGGWTCHPIISLSAPNLAIVGGQSAGHMYTLVVIDELTRDPATGRSIMDIQDENNDDILDFTDKQDDAWEESREAIYHNLLGGVDGRDIEDGFSFEARDDAWDERKGVNLAKLKARWDTLQDWRDNQIAEDWDAERTVLRPLEDRNSVWYSGKYFKYDDVEADASSSSNVGKTRGIYGGTLTVLIKVIQVLSQQYLASYQGSEDTGADGGLCGSLWGVFNGRERNVSNLEGILDALQYRMTQMTMADEYLEFMGIPPPKGQACHAYDTRKIEKEVGGKKFSANWQIVLDRSVLSPQPYGSHQGHGFDKGSRYLIAAFYYAGVDRKIMIEKLDELARREKDIATLDRFFQARK